MAHMSALVPKLSLVAKFAPSQGGQHSKLLQADEEIGKHLFPPVQACVTSTQAGDVNANEVASAAAKYRRLLSSLRRALEVPEVLMCAQQWAEINFAKVSSLCLDRNKRAFLNEGKGRPLDNKDRVACRENLLTMIVEKGVNALKGKQVLSLLALLVQKYRILTLEALRSALPARTGAAGDEPEAAARDKQQRPALRSCMYGPERAVGSCKAGLA